MNCHIGLSGYRREGRVAIKIRLKDNPASREEEELVYAVEIAIGQLLLTPRDVLERQDPKSLVNELASWIEPADRKLFL